MRILQLIDSLNLGGAERMCVNISNLLTVQGHEVTLCATRSGGPLEKSVATGIKLHILGKKNSFDIVAFWRFQKILKDNEIEVIHAHSSSLFWAIAAKCLSGNVKVIWHDHLGLRVNDRKKTPVYKLLSAKIDGIISVNQELSDWSRKNMKVPAARIVMINNFPALPSVERNPDPEFFTIVCLANLRPQKDHETLIRAVSLLNAKLLPKKLKVILAGSVDDSNYANKVRKLIVNYDLENTIEMAGSVEDTASLLAKADCGVLCSVSEGLPVSLLEYGFSALPTVVTNVGYCSTVIGQGKYGRLIASGDPKLLSEEILYYISNPIIAKQIGLSFKEHVINNYGAGNYLNAYLKLLRGILTS